MDLLSFVLLIQYPIVSVFFLGSLWKAKIWKYSSAPSRVLWSIFFFVFYLLSLLAFLLVLVRGWSSMQIAFVFFVGMVFPVIAYLVFMLSDKTYLAKKKHAQMQLFVSIAGILLIYATVGALAERSFENIWARFSASPTLKLLAYVLSLPFMWATIHFLLNKLRAERQKERGEWSELIIEFTIIFIVLTFLMIF